MPLDVTLLHNPQSGIDAAQLGIGPRNYARQLARYIRDASTIRARTLDEWGRAPSVHECRAMIADAQASRQRYADESNRLAHVDADEAGFAPKATEQAARAARRHAHAVALEKVKAAIETEAANDRLPNQHPKTIPEVLVAVAKGMDVTLETLLGPCRKRQSVDARLVACFALRARGLSTPQIGDRLNRDHSTVVHALRCFDAKATDHMRELAAIIIGWRKREVAA